MPWPLFTPRNDPVPTVLEAAQAPGPVWTDAENLTPTGIRSPDRPARSQSLYQQRYLAHRPVNDLIIIIGYGLIQCQRTVWFKMFFFYVSEDSSSLPTLNAMQ
jgi:hypothetical protein